VRGELSPRHPTPFVAWCGNSGSAEFTPHHPIERGWHTNEIGDGA